MLLSDSTPCDIIVFFHVHSVIGGIYYLTERNFCITVFCVSCWGVQHLILPNLWVTTYDEFLPIHVVYVNLPI